MDALAIRWLAPDERAQYADHLKRLDAADRQMRFCGLPSDAAIDALAAGLTAQDGVLGAFQDDRLVAAVHVALTAPGEAEFGLSVDRPFRRGGLGRRLFDAALAAVRERGVHRVEMCCLARNQAIMRLARAARMAVVVEDGDGRAWIEVAGA